MPSDEELSQFSRRAARVRVIAQGVFDKQERDLLLALVTVAEKLAKREVRSRKHR